MPATSRDAGRIEVPAGTVLFRPNDPCPGFVVVERGAIKVSLTGASGREIVLYRVAPGDVCLQTFSYLVEGRPYTAQGVAEESLAATLIPPRDFEARFLGDAAFRRSVLGAIARRFADFEHVVETLAFTALEARVAAAVLRLAGAAPEIRATHEAIAVEIGSAREAVSRQLGVLAKQGLVGLSRGRIQLLDREGLESVARQAG